MSHKCVTISDFNLENFNAFLRNSEEQPLIDTVEVPFGQVHQVLMDPDHACWREPVDIAFIWTQPQSVIDSFRRVLMHQPVMTEEILDEVEDYAEHLGALRDRARIVLVPTWEMPHQERGLGIFDYGDARGASNMLLRMNLRLAERLANQSSVFLLNSNQWTQRNDSAAFNTKLWYMAKMAFSNVVFKKAAADVKTALRSLEGQSKKLIVLDLDNTLWGGVVGDVGREGIVLGGHDPVGEAYVDFQTALKSLQMRGVVLAIASKNEEAVALDAIQNHPEMVLRPDDFVTWRINWQDKAQNIVDITQQLNLGLQSTVFIDDNPAERDRVRHALDEVFVPDWPADPLMYRSALIGLSCFDIAAISTEDLQRSEMYQQQQKRESAKKNVTSVEDWLASLDTRVRVERLSDQSLVRAAQLLNKTNQMNLATRRLSQRELQEWSDQESRAFWVIYVEDKFGAQGLTGLCSLQEEAGRGEIVDFVLSCRVMGRRIEEAMLSVAIACARERGLSGIDALYKPTNKNMPCLAFFERSGMRRGDAENLFHWECEDEFPVPEQIRLVFEQA